MILVKFLIALKRLIYSLAVLVLRPIFLIFKFLLTKPLIKLYHLIFRLKKSSLAKSSWQEVLKQRSLHVLVFCLTVIITISNFVNLNHNSNDATASASKTIVSHLVRNEFSTITDESALIEETSNLRQILASSHETYEDWRTMLTNRSWVSNPSEENADLTYLNGVLVNNTPIISEEGATATAKTPGASKQTIARTEIISYTVENGDTISSIANKFKISINTILWSNNLTAYSLIRPGNKLTILPVSGTVYTVKSGDTIGQIARQFGVEEDDIYKYNNISRGLKIGKTIIIPGGKKMAEPAPETTLAKNSIVTKTHNAVAVIEKLVNPKQAPESGTRLLWPTEGHRITQYYSWRHTAIDIANHVGTPLYAADDGTVIFAGWSNGYGNNVVIDHGGGMKTRYAHASRLFVKVGQSVDRGEEIAAMGSTGWSTGPHIHFEVMINNVKYNPLNYVR